MTNFPTIVDNCLYTTDPFVGDFLSYLNINSLYKLYKCYVFSVLLWADDALEKSRLTEPLNTEVLRRCSVGGELGRAASKVLNRTISAFASLYLAKRSVFGSSADPSCAMLLRSLVEGCRLIGS